MHLFQMLVILLLSLLAPGSALGPLCLKCNYAINPDECEQVIRCSDHEECYMQQFVTPSGHILYDLGCMDQYQCKGFGNPAQPIVGKRKVEVRKRAGSRPFDIVDIQDNTGQGQEDYVDGRAVNCEACCNSGDVCNNGGMCGTKPFNYNGGRLCYHCDQQFRPDDCDRIKLCPQDRNCTATTSSSATRCRSCCQGQLCNHECKIPTGPPPTPAPTTTPRPTTTSTTTTAKPPPTRTPRPTTTSTTTTAKPLSPPYIYRINVNPNPVRYGDTVHLYCVASGNPAPEIVLEMLATQGNQPKNVHVNANTEQLTIYNYTPENDFSYKCCARNSLGTVNKTVALNGFVENAVYKGILSYRK